MLTLGVAMCFLFRPFINMCVKSVGLGLVFLRNPAISALNFCPTTFHLLQETLVAQPQAAMKGLTFSLWLDGGESHCLGESRPIFRSTSCRAHNPSTTGMCMLSAFSLLTSPFSSATSPAKFQRKGEGCWAGRWIFACGTLSDPSSFPAPRMLLLSLCSPAPREFQGSQLTCRGCVPLQFSPSQLPYIYQSLKTPGNVCFLFHIFNSLINMGGNCLYLSTS